MEIEENIQWHPAFCSAMELELRSYKKYLRYEREHNLGKMPLRIDFLVIRKAADIKIENEIGDFFLKTNIFEYKSPGDAINVRTFYKAVSYACLYKAEEEDSDDRLDMDMTVSIVREEKPLKLLKQIGEKYSVEQKAKGIYRVNGLMFPVQFVVTKELDKDTHIWIASLTRTMDRGNAQKLIDKYTGLKDEKDRHNAGSVVNVASEANIGLFKKMIQEGDYMCEELKEMLAPEIIEFKIQLARQKEELADKDARLADNAAEIARLKMMLSEMGVNA